MPKRSTVYALPDEVRENLNARLVGAGFGGYEDLADWLAGEGYQISKSALHRYGQDLQADFDAAMSDVRKTTELARAYVQSDQDEQGALIDATQRMAQESLLRIVIALRQAEDDPAAAAHHMVKVSRALSDLSRATISTRKYQAEVRAKAEAAAKQVEDVGRQGGLGPDRIAELRKIVTGIAA